MSLKAIRDVLASKTDQFPMSTVIRWTSGGRYTYVAVKTQAGWYHSGSVNAEYYVGRNPLTFDDLLSVFASDLVTDIEVAQEWVAVGVTPDDEPAKGPAPWDEPQAKRAPRHIPKENFSREPVSDRPQGEPDPSVDYGDEEPSYYGDEGDVGFGGSGEHV